MLRYSSVGIVTETYGCVLSFKGRHIATFSVFSVVCHIAQMGIAHRSSKMAQCTCSPTIRQCPACLAWAQNHKVAQRERSGVVIRDGLVAGTRRYTTFSRETIERVQKLFVAGIPNDVIAELCGVAYGSISYLIHMEVCDG